MLSESKKDVKSSSKSRFIELLGRAISSFSSKAKGKSAVSGSYNDKQTHQDTSGDVSEKPRDTSRQ